MSYPFVRRHVAVLLPAALAVAVACTSHGSPAAHAATPAPAPAPPLAAPPTPAQSPIPARPVAFDSMVPERREIKSADGSVLRYALLVPPHESTERLPLVLVLHGRETADGSVPDWAGERFLRGLFQPALAPLHAVMVAPDAPIADWTDSVSIQAVFTVLADVRRQYEIDDRRTLVSGFSMGGIGAWFFAANYPTRFRAALAAAGLPRVRQAGPDDNEETLYRQLVADTAATWANVFQRMPIYVIHSRQDEVVPFGPDSVAVARIRAKGGPVEFLMIDDMEHSPASLYQAHVRTTLPWIERQWARP